MTKGTLLLLLCCGCAGVNRGRPTAAPARLQAHSFSNASIATVLGGSISIVNWAPFQWKENDANAVAYNLYYGSLYPHEYDQVISGITNLSCVVSNLMPGTTYYLAATAVDTMGDESDFSDEYVYVMPTVLEMGFAFDPSVTNVSVQSSTDLMTWQPSNARPRTNGLWRVDVDPAFPVEFYRGIGQVAPAL